MLIKKCGKEALEAVEKWAIRCKYQKFSLYG